jgi:hypothetical protein
MISQCRHIKGCWNNVSEHVHGTRGSANLSGEIFDAKGDKIWAYGKGGGGGHQEEHFDLFAALRKGERPNEADYGAKSTMTAVLGRDATYSGKVIKWDDAINTKKTLADFDAFQGMSDEAPVKPDDNGKYPIPVPGKTVTI